MPKDEDQLPVPWRERPGLKNRPGADSQMKLIEVEEQAATAGAREVVTTLMDVMGREEIPIPRAHRAIVGRHAKALLEDGFEFELVVIAAVTAVRRGDPRIMQFIAADLVMAQAGQRMTRRQYERALQDEQELRGDR